MNTGRRVLKNTFVLSIGQFTILAIGIIWTAFLARYIGPKTYGLYAYAQSVLSILTLFVNFGFEQLLVRDVAQKPSLGTRYVVTIISLKLILSVLILGGFVIYVYFRGWSEEQTYIMLIVTVSCFVGTISSVLIYTLYVHQAMVYDTVSSILRAVLALGTGLLAIKMKRSFPTILVVLLMVSVLQVMLNFYFVRKVMRKAGTKESERILSFSFAIQLMVKSIPFAALALIAVLYSNVVILLLRNLVHDDIVVGNFAAAQRIYSMIFIVPSMFLQSIFPAFSRTYAESPKHFGTMFEQAYRYMFFITVPMAVGLWIISPQIVLMIYGAEFATAGSSLRILSFCLLNGVGFIMGPAMSAMNRQTLSAVIFGGALIGVAVAGYLVIPSQGSDGACWAVVTGNAIGFVVYACILFRWLRLTYPLLWVTRTIIASVVMGVVVYILASYINFLVVSFLIAPVAYLLMHRMLKTFSLSDRDQMIKSMPGWLSRIVPVLVDKK
jgi:O-antigen/teichoic acid export membrane protein